MTLFELLARLVLDTASFERGIASASGKMQTFANGAKRVLAGVNRVAAAGVATVATATGAMLKNSIEYYAEYEQLIGGIETLFKESAPKVQQYAAEAFRTAGVSANDYMETVTSFSASLLQSLSGDVDAAADAANQAVIDMADNAAKMGTPLASIHDAYMSIARGQYQLLDNLKLGYGGTKTEMERLLKDAGKLANTKFDINNLNDVYKAIHVIQTELGITGTTAAEAADTISGSFAALKASWQNFLIFLPSNDKAMQRKTVDSLKNSAKDVLKNLVPTIKNGVAGLAEVARYTLEEVLPDLLNSIDIEEGGILGNIAGFFRDIGTWARQSGGVVLPVLAGIATAIFAITHPIAAVVAGVALLAANWNTVTGAINNAIGALKNYLYIGEEKGIAVHKTESGEWKGGGVGQGFATGLDYVPHNDFVARLHEGEAVLTKAENAERLRGGSNQGLSASDILDAVTDGIREGMKNVAVVMDGRTVGEMTEPFVSAEISRKANARRYG